MITISNLAMQFGGSVLFKQVDLQFTPGSCYGIIGANGAGKSTFLKLLSGELEPTSGEIFIKPGARMSVLKQDQNQYDAYTILDTVIMGNQHLYDVMKEKDALYEKPDFSEEDGMRASELEAEFADMDGWEAESDVSRLIQGLGLSEDILYSEMSTLTAKEKVKVLLAQALFGKPDIILLDEPTNHLDIHAVEWLEDFILECESLIIVVSHDRHFLNTVCTNIVDVDYGGIKMYVGNYEFWYESSQMMQRLIRDQNKKKEEKIKELQEFVSRFSANKSKSKQATARRKLLDKLTVEEMPASSRRYPFVGFKMDREPGKEILAVEGLTKTVDGRKVLDNVSFRVNKGDKIAFLARDPRAVSALFDILVGDDKADSGVVEWGTTINYAYLPLNNAPWFESQLSIVDWLAQFSSDTSELYLRGYLGKMLFSGEEIYKKVSVLSGGEKVRCMVAKMMIQQPNTLVLDSPTNHLDLESITAVNNGLSEFKGNLLFASHDHEILETAANRIIEITENGCLDRQGTYDDFVAWRHENVGGKLML